MAATSKIREYYNYFVSDVRELSTSPISETVTIYVEKSIFIFYDSNDIVQYYYDKVKKITLAKTVNECRVYCYDENDEQIGPTIYYTSNKLSFLAFTVYSIETATEEIDEFDGLNGVTAFERTSKIEVDNHGALIDDEDLNYANVDSEIISGRDDGLRDIKITVKDGYKFDERRINAYIQLGDIGFDDEKIKLPSEWFEHRSDRVIFTVPANFIVSTETTDTFIHIEAYFKEKKPATGKVYDCKLENKAINVKDGFIINDELNETLDSGTIQYLNKHEESEIEPFDSIVFESDVVPHFQRKKLLIESFEAEITNFHTNIEQSDFFYTSNLVSETKFLERITCPNLTITKRPDGTVVTVWDKIKQYCRTYLPRIFVYDENQTTKKKLKCIYKYDPELETKFSMECPELSWNAPTLKEVLIDLFNVADCIPVIKDNILTFFNLDQRGKEIDASKLLDYRPSFSGADYCDELTINLQNTITKTVTKKEYVTARAIDSGEMTTNNMCFVTQKPIYNIKSFKVMAGAFIDPLDYQSAEAGLQTRELVPTSGKPYILEDAEWNLLNPREKRLTRTDKAYNYKAFVLHYTRGSNIIKDIGTSIELSCNWRAGQLVVETETDSRISWAFGAARAYGGQIIGETERTRIKNTNIRKVVVCIEYETIDETTLNVGKLAQIKHPSNKLFDGQASSMVDTERQTVMEYAKANRLGNKIKTIYGVYYDEADVPQLGDTLGEKVLFSRTISYFDNQIKFEGKVIDNYILRDYFTGVLSQRRSWAIASEREATKRHDVIKFYLTASLNHQAVNMSQYDIPYMIDGDYGHFVDIFTGTVSELYTMENVLDHLRGKDGFLPSENDYIIMESNMSSVGRSFIVDFGFIDNMLAGYTVNRDGSNFDVSISSYCDSNGEYNWELITLVHYVDPAEGEDYRSMLSWLAQPDNWDSDEGQRVWDLVNDYSNRKPLTTLDALSGRSIRIARNSYQFVKDNRETIKTTVQFEYTSDNKDIIVTDKLASYCALWKTASTTLKLYEMSNDTYKPYETKARGGLSSRTITLQSYNDTSSSPYQELIIGSGFPQLKNWCICDADDNILIAVNGGHSRIKFEVRYIRDNNVYNNQIDRVPIGKTHETIELVEAYEENPADVFLTKVLGRTIYVDDTKDF